MTPILSPRFARLLSAAAAALALASLAGSENAARADVAKPSERD